MFMENNVVSQFDLKHIKCFSKNPYFTMEKHSPMANNCDLRPNISLLTKNFVSWPDLANDSPTSLPPAFFPVFVVVGQIALMFSTVRAIDPV